MPRAVLSSEYVVVSKPDVRSSVRSFVQSSRSRAIDGLITVEYDNDHDLLDYCEAAARLKYLIDLFLFSIQAELPSGIRAEAMTRLNLGLVERSAIESLNVILDRVQPRELAKSQRQVWDVSGAIEMGQARNLTRATTLLRGFAQRADIKWEHLETGDDLAALLRTNAVPIEHLSEGPEAWGGFMSRVASVLETPHAAFYEGAGEPLRSGTSVPAREREARLALLAREGSSEAFGELYELTRNTVFRFVFLHKRNHQEAEDIVQEVYLYGWLHLDAFGKSSRSFSAWLLLIARTQIEQSKRSKSRSKATMMNLRDYLLAETTNSNDPTYQVVEERQLLAEAINALSVSQLEPLLLLYMEGYSVAESADILNVSSGAVRARAQRAIYRLRKMAT